MMFLHLLLYYYTGDSIGLAAGFLFLIIMNILSHEESFNFEN